MDERSVSPENIQFSIADYIVFILLLVASSLIGIYYGFVAKKKQDNTAEYLLGGKQLTLFPISISLIVSHISGITMLGTPTEIYAYGTQFWISFVSALAVPISILYIFYPVFYDLQLLSTFMYFEKRYNRKLRQVASAVYLCGCTVFLPIVIYIPALAFNQVSGVNVHIITSIICVVCVFYTAIGGLRAVVWTDTIQFFLMFGAVISIIILGLLQLDSPLDVWTAADRGKRLIFFDFNPNPLVRTTFWTHIIGLTTLWVSIFGSAQSCIQKLLSVPDQKTAKRAVWIFAAGYITFNFVAIATGLVMYAYLEKCDPYVAGFVTKLDQVLPYFVMKVSSQIPGLPGLFIAGIFSGALSTMSGLLNIMSCIIYDDFLRNRLANCSEKTTSNILKMIVLIIGAIITGLVFVVEKLGPVFQMALTLSGVSAGTLLGLFTTGMLCRKINTKGATCGAIASVLLVGIITIGGRSQMKPQNLPMRTDGCETPLYQHIYSTNGSSLNTLISLESELNSSDEELFWLFRISFMYYTLIGCVTVWIVSYPISVLTSKSSKPVDEKLLAPFMRNKSTVKAIEIQDLPKDHKIC